MRTHRSACAAPLAVDGRAATLAPKSTRRGCDCRHPSRGAATVDGPVAASWRANRRSYSWDRPRSQQQLGCADTGCARPAPGRPLAGQASGPAARAARSSVATAATARVPIGGPVPTGRARRWLPRSPGWLPPPAHHDPSPRSRLGARGPLACPASRSRTMMARLGSRRRRGGLRRWGIPRAGPAPQPGQRGCWRRPGRSGDPAAGQARSADCGR